MGAERENLAGLRIDIGGNQYPELKAFWWFRADSQGISHQSLMRNVVVIFNIIRDLVKDQTFARFYGI